MTTERKCCSTYGNFFSGPQPDMDGQCVWTHDQATAREARNG